MDLQDEAYKLERVSLEKMLQLVDNTAKKGNKFKALILGLGNRVRLYKQEIAEAKSFDSKKDHVPFDGTVGPQEASGGEMARDP